MQRLPKILIYGHGFVGRKMLSALDSVVLGAADIAVRRELEYELERIQPDVVINCAGRTGIPNIDWCERNKWRTWYSNALGAKTLGNACQHRSVFLIHLSSGCMFHSDSPCQVWQEWDQPRAFNFYTNSKLFAEEALSDCYAAVVRIRLPLDVTIDGRNALTKISRFRVVTRALNSVTVLDDLVTAVKLIIKHQATGVFHCVSPEPISLADIKRLMHDYGMSSGNFLDVESRDLVRLGLVRTERSDAILGINRLLDLGFSPQSTKQAICRVLKRYAQQRNSLNSNRELVYAS